MSSYSNYDGYESDQLDQALLGFDDETEAYEYGEEEFEEDDLEFEDDLEWPDELEQEEELEWKRRRFPVRRRRPVRRVYRRPRRRPVYRYRPPYRYRPKYRYRPAYRRRPIYRYRPAYRYKPVYRPPYRYRPFYRRPGRALWPRGYAAYRPGYRKRYYKGYPDLRRIRLAPRARIRINRTWPPIRKALAETYNRLGGLMQVLGRPTGVDVPAILAVWYVQSRGRRHTPGRPIIRFENHIFYRLWGKNNKHIYDRHFRHGGYGGRQGKIWQNHQFRENPNQKFQPVHGNQDLEYRALMLAARLAGVKPALLSTRIGGPQILISRYRLLGYSSPLKMFGAFQAGERAQVLRFFDLCRRRSAPRPGDLLRYLRSHKWLPFARNYGGPSTARIRARRLLDAYNHARRLVPGPTSPVIPLEVSSSMGGRGRMGGTRPGAGPGGYCICPSCGQKVLHEVGVPCYSEICPSCGANLVRG